MTRLSRLLVSALAVAQTALSPGAGHADIADAPAAVALTPGRVFHISPDGSDGNDGSRDAPWLTWSRATVQLRPGDTLVAMPGNYTPSGAGIPDIRCGGPVSNGTAYAPITVVSELPRQAVLHPGAVTGPAGPTWSALMMRDCAWWRVIGLRFEGSDTAGPGRPENGFGGLVHVSDSAHIELRQLFARRANRYGNHHLIVIQLSEDVLVEETELYDFCRHGISVPEGTRITLRRNYANVNAYPIVPGHWESPPGPDCTKGGAGAAFVIYPARDSILENNISEHSGYGILAIEPDGFTGLGSRNRILGNIGNDNHRDLAVDNRSREQAAILIVNHVAARPRTVGLWTTSGVRGLACRNCSLLGGDVTFGAARGADLDDTAAVSSDRAAIVNSLLLDHPREGIRVVGDWTSCRIEDTTSSGNAFDVPASGCEASRVSTDDPNVGEPPGERIGLGEGDCIVYIPLGNSALKATGRLGADRGANVVFRYEGGLPTPWKVWGGEGSFSCGPDVLGAGDRCQNVHERLHVGTHGCPIP